MMSETEQIAVELIDGETGRCIGINEYRVCGPKPIRGVVVTSWKTTKNDVLRAFLTPDEKHDWLTKDLTVVPVEQTRLAALVPKLVEALADMVEIIEDEGHTSSYIPQVTAARKILAETALARTAKESEV